MVFRGITDPSTLEALACREALALSLDLSLTRVVAACDCKAVVQEIKTDTEGKYSAIIKDITERSMEFRSCEIIFEGHSLNFYAHNLGKFSLSLEGGYHLWLVSPHDPFAIPLNRTLS